MVYNFRMIQKTKSFLKDILFFVRNNLFIFITGFLIVAKLYYFNEVFELMNEKMVMFVVSTVIIFCFLSPIVFSPNKRIKYATIWNTIFSLLILSDMIYIRYFDSLPSIQSIFYADSVFGVMGSVKGLLHLSDIILIIDIPILIYIFRRFRKSGIKEFDLPSPRRYNILFFASCLSCLSLMAIIDFDNVRLQNTKVYDNRVTAERYSVTGYHLMDIYRFAKSSISKLSEEEKKKVITESKSYIKPLAVNDKTGKAKSKNIIIVQFESLQDFVVDKKINEQEITPNINKFIKESDYFNNNYFEIGFGGTADTDFVANSSFYPLNNASTFVQYGNHEYIGLADYLKTAGYETNAYHGFKRSFWNRNIALKALGYDKFYASESYEGYKKVQMGANDQDFMKKTAELIESSHKPSFNYIITLTSHFPFKIPAKERELTIDSQIPKSLSDYYQAIHYSDTAFGMLVESLKAKGLYDDSLIILYGDHYAKVGELDDQLVYKSLGFDQAPTIQESTEFKQVPLVIHNPGQKENHIYSEVSSLIDIVPTILNQTGIMPYKPYFGRDLYGKENPYFAANSFFGNGFIESKEYVYLDGTVEGVENGQCYRIENKKWEHTTSQSCASLVNKREVENNLSEKMIKYDLIKEIN